MGVLERNFSFVVSDGAFELLYRGERLEVGETLCYRIEGYNETCRATPLPNLIMGMRIRLMAPNVPDDLLRGYTLLLRFPDLAPSSIRVVLDDTEGSP